MSAVEINNRIVVNIIELIVVVIFVILYSSVCLLEVAFRFVKVTDNVRPAAASAGFTWLMLSFSMSFSDLINACLRKPPVLLAAGLLGVVNIYIIL